MNIVRSLLTAGLALLLAGCHVELYRALPEEEANQMLAILMLHHLDADKQEAEGGITLRVEQSQFINAVELLRLNGFPRHRYTSAEAMFPANQLVVSPEEEQQKISFLKEQKVEGMLSQMEGIINVNVAIAIASQAGENETSAPSRSVAVFIKYSPQVNLEELRVQIKELIEKSIPGLQYGKISIVMQPAEFRMATPAPVASASLGPSSFTTQKHKEMQWLTKHYFLLALSFATLLLCLILLQFYRRLNRKN